MGELSENVNLLCADYQRILCDGILNHFQKGEWTDMSIGGSGFDVGVHRIIISIFSSAFSSDNQANYKLKHNNISQEDMSTILDFVYKGEISIERQRMDKIKKGAEILGFNSLVNTIDEYIALENESKETTPNKRKLKTPTKKVKSGVQPSTCQLSLRKKKPVNYLENKDEVEEEEDSDDDIPLLENAILIELEDDDDDEEEEEEEDDGNENEDDGDVDAKRLCQFGLDSGLFVKRNKRIQHLDLSDLNFDQSVSNEFDSSDWEVLRQQYQASHSKPPAFAYTCTDCGYVCDKKLILTRHIHKEHSKDRPFKCNHCDYRGKTLSSLKSHSEMHSDEKFTCSICSQKFTLSCSLNRHMKLHLTSEKKNACHLCNSKYRRVWDLKVHLKQVHKVEPPDTPKRLPTVTKSSQKFKCDQCDYEVWDQIRYVNHLAIRHHLDPQGNELQPKHKCEHCDFVCFTKSQLSSHSDRMHSDKTFPCTQCDYVSPRKTDLNQHMLRKHSEQKHYMCETCGFLCATQRYLSRHQETHQGNQYVCGVCNMKFTLRSSLKRHGKLHITDEKPFGCHMCAYSTRKRYNLKCHLKRIHKVDLPPNEPIEKVVYQIL